MQPRGLSHLAVMVPDLDAAFVFYRDVLGFQVRSEPKPFRMGQTLGASGRTPVGDSRNCLFDLGDGTALEVIEYFEDEQGRFEQSKEERISINSVGFMALSIKVDDAAAAYEALCAAGAEVLCEPRPGPLPIFFVVAPGGVVFELIQYPEGVSTLADAIAQVRGNG